MISQVTFLSFKVLVNKKKKVLTEIKGKKKNKFSGQSVEILPSVVIAWNICKRID